MAQRYVASRAQVKIGARQLDGLLAIPDRAHGIVVFAGDAGQNIDDEPQATVAAAYHDSGLATLVFRYLTTNEANDKKNAFDADLLASRLVDAVRWTSREPPTEQLPVGLLGVGFGGAAALAAACMSDRVRALVICDGRPDFVPTSLTQIHTPTLFVVGDADRALFDVNVAHLRELGCQKRLEIVFGATGVLSSPTTTDRLAEVSTRWFEQYLHKSPSGGDLRQSPA